MTEEMRQNPSWSEKQYTGKQRAKKYALVVYPRDMPEDWKTILAETFWDVIISPLHDRDVNADGTKKKPHYHILVSAGKSWITMSELAELGRKLKGVALPQQCSNPKGMVRYFIHIDNPEKVQYKKSDIEVIGNYDIEEYFKASIGEERATRQEIVKYIFENKITELSDLILYTLDNNERWDDFIATHTIYINQIIRSLRHRKFKVDPETGEIIK